MRVLLCIIDAVGTCSQALAVSLLRLQRSMTDAPNVSLTVHAAATLSEAAVLARKDGYEALVAIHHDIAFPPSFVARALANPHPFLSGVYPLPVLDWNRVASTPRDCTEDLSFRGNAYNIDGAEARQAPGGLVAVKRAKLGAVVLKGPALEAIAASDATSDEGQCAAWGQDIYVDLDNPCQSTGQMEFMGCIGTRAFASAEVPA